MSININMGSPQDVVDAKLKATSTINVDTSVTSVNGKKGTVTLIAEDIPYQSASPELQQPGNVEEALDQVATALGNKQATLVSGTNIKTINDTSLLGSGNISITVPAETDPTVPSWAKQSTKPHYESYEIGAQLQTSSGQYDNVDSALNALEYDKQDNLVSGTNIKTINSTSLLGSGNISIPTEYSADEILYYGSAYIGYITENATNVEGAIATLDLAVQGKQNTLVSGTSIKTINNTSLLGSGNITIAGSNDLFIVNVTLTDTPVIAGTSDKTSQEIYEATVAGKVPVVRASLYGTYMVATLSSAYSFEEELGVTGYCATFTYEDQANLYYKYCTMQVIGTGVSLTFRDEYQTKLTFDSSPTISSGNPVTSNGIYNALVAKQSTSITDTGGYFTTDTVEGALQEIGAELVGKQNITSIVNKTSSDTTNTLETDKFYVFPEMSTLSVTVTSTGMYAFRFTSGSTATTLTVTGATMPDSFTVEANKVYEINIYQGYGVASSWTTS